MGCCNEPVSTLTGVPPDPSQHVNYARGMVLGVDDFVQEFAYLDGHTRWLAREAVGYGTVTGLRVRIEDDGSEGPRVHVHAGSALMPSGKLVCVAADQCAILNRWLAKPDNAAIVTRLLSPSSPPMSPPLPPAPGESGEITLYLTLCESECLTRPVPIPGEPCRSEDALMADSRVADDFKLELREAAPAQVEEDALRDFVRWLRGSVQAVDASPAPAADEAVWLDALRQAAQPWLAAQSASPPMSPPASIATLGDYLFDSSPPALQVAAADMPAFLRVALRFWVTELRPMWTALRCHRAQWPDTGCVLLAQLRFDVTWIGGSPSGAWQVTGGASTVAVDESARPWLAHLRMLQEWVLADTATPVAAQDTAPTSAPQFAGLTTTGAVQVALTTTAVNLTLGDTHHVVICAGGQTVQLPKAAASNRGRVYIVKSVASVSTVAAAAGDAIAGPTATPGNVNTNNAKTFVSDGVATWHVIATVA